MKNINKRKLNKHIRIVDELYSETRAMERSLYANGMGMASYAYGDVSKSLEEASDKLHKLKQL